MMCMCLSNNAHLITIIVMAMITVIMSITVITPAEIAISKYKLVDSRKREII